MRLAGGLLTNVERLSIITRVHAIDAALRQLDSLVDWDASSVKLVSALSLARIEVYDLLTILEQGRPSYQTAAELTYHAGSTGE
jgi:hypothetical protein